REEKVSTRESMKACCSYHWRGKLTIIIPLITLPILIYGLVKKEPAYKCMYLVLNMAIFWITECIPLYITSLFPVVFLPLFGILNSDAVCRLFLTDTLIMFLGGLVVALAVEYSNLNTRIALGTILLVGCSIRRLHFGIIMVTVLISMWLSNSATTAMMCPIVKAVLNEMNSQSVFEVYMSQEEEPVEEGDSPHPSKISMAFYFGIAYSSTIGGCGTLIGTGTNLTFKGLYETRFPHSKEKVDFPIFMAYAMPLVTMANAILVFITLQITHMGLLRPKSKVGQEIARGSVKKDVVKRVVSERYDELGPWTCHEIQVLIVFLVMIALLLTHKPGFMKGWADIINAKNIGSSTPVMLSVFILFALPTQYTFFKYCCGSAPFTGRTMDACLSWVYVHRQMPWGLCFLLGMFRLAFNVCMYGILQNGVFIRVGGGFSLAEGSRASGMAKLLGDSMSFVSGLHEYLVVAIALAFSFFCTTFASNVAICNILIPVYCELVSYIYISIYMNITIIYYELSVFQALAIKMHPLLLTLPSMLAISMSYFLPVSTPPNAIVCAYANIKTKYLALAGIMPTVWGFLMLWVNALTWGMVVFPATREFPDWAK
ncbi:hypothetical protein KR222_003119, partial [Zaprionus bogoriensis]